MIYHRYKKANKSEPCVVEWIETSEGEGYCLLAVNGSVVWSGADKYGEGSTQAHDFIQEHQEEWAKAAGIEPKDILFVSINWCGLSHVLDPDHAENYSVGDYWGMGEGADYSVFTDKLAQWPPVFKLGEDKSYLIRTARGLDEAADKLFLR